MNKAGYTDQNRLDPQWVPSDAEMINWVEANEYRLIPQCRMDNGLDGWAVKRISTSLFNLGEGSTWRAAVEDAMRKEARQSD